MRRVICVHNASGWNIAVWTELRCPHISLRLIKSLIILSVTDPDISLGQIPDVNFTSHQSCYWEWGSVAAAVGSKVNLVAMTTSFRCISGGLISLSLNFSTWHLTAGWQCSPFHIPAPIWVFTDSKRKKRKANLRYMTCDWLTACISTCSPSYWLACGCIPAVNFEREQIFQLQGSGLWLARVLHHLWYFSGERNFLLSKSISHNSTLSVTSAVAAYVVVQQVDMQQVITTDKYCYCEKHYSSFCSSI